MLSKKEVVAVSANLNRAEEYGYTLQNCVELLQPSEMGPKLLILARDVIRNRVIDPCINVHGADKAKELCSGVFSPDHICRVFSRTMGKKEDINHLFNALDVMTAFHAPIGASLQDTLGDMLAVSEMPEGVKTIDGWMLFHNLFIDAVQGGRLSPEDSGTQQIYREGDSLSIPGREGFQWATDVHPPARGAGRCGISPGGR